MTYQHRYADNTPCALPVGKVVCVGRNYAEHAKELGNAVPAEPILFIKPRTAVTSLLQPVRVPPGQGACHFETEIALLIGSTLTQADEDTAREAIAGIGLGLDLTLREVQDALKAKGLPWEKAKAFDGACPLSPFVRPAPVADLANLRLRLQVNGENRQDGNSSDMLTPVLPLLVYMSRHFTLEPGDVVMTGTPRGVGPLLAGDAVRVTLGEDLLVVETRAV